MLSARTIFISGQNLILATKKNLASLKYRNLLQKQSFKKAWLGKNFFGQADGIAIHINIFRNEKNNKNAQQILMVL